MVTNAIDPNQFQDANVKTLANINPAKLQRFQNKYKEYVEAGGKMGEEDFICSCLGDEGGIDPITGNLPAVYVAEQEAHSEFKTPFKSAVCHALANRDFDRCCDLIKEYGQERKRPGSLANKLDMETYIELHANLEPGEFPWPSDIQAAIAKAGKQ